MVRAEARSGRGQPAAVQLAHEGAQRRERVGQERVVDVPGDRARSRERVEEGQVAAAVTKAGRAAYGLSRFPWCSVSTLARSCVSRAASGASQSAYLVWK